MKENTKQVLLHLISAVAVTLVILGFWTFCSILSLPPKFTIEIAMDNNTREAMQSINYTAINQPQDSQMCFSNQEGDLRNGILIYCRYENIDCWKGFLNWSGRHGMYWNYSKDKLNETGGKNG